MPSVDNFEAGNDSKIQVDVVTRGAAGVGRHNSDRRLAISGATSAWPIHSLVVIVPVSS